MKKMKKYTLKALALILSLFFLGSCERYLDKAPDAGLTETEVFEKFANFKLFFEAAYNGTTKNSSGTWYQVNIRTGHALWISMWDQKTLLDDLTEIGDNGRLIRQYWKQGLMGTDGNMLTNDLARRPVQKAMFTVIRICNTAIANAHRIKDAAENEKDDFIGQAYFLRGYAHLTLINYWGPMPHLTKVIGEDPSGWDLKRPSKLQAYKNVAADMDSAFIFFTKASVESTNKIRRDDAPGGSGHLVFADNIFRPSGVAAKAIKGRALMYGASPLNNANGAKDWEDAAVANWDAIQLALNNAYELMPMSRYSENYLAKYSNEQLFAWHAGNGFSSGSGEVNGLLSGALANKPSGYSGECPTQNMIDKFETKWGESLVTQADRDAATLAGHYKEQDPYVNRDPRFYSSIIYNQAPIVYSTYLNKAQIWYQLDANGGTVYGEMRNEVKYQGCTRTGYYSKKHIGDMSGGNTSYKPYMTDPLIRLGEVYLNYAEAANEAYGPNGSAPGGITATNAVNAIRARATLPPLTSQYTGSKEALRAKIKLERTVELCFEGYHHYFDIRRWKDAPIVMTETLEAINALKVTVSSTYPTGYKYTRSLLPADRQARWKDAMYYLPLDADDYYKMKNFDTSLNPKW
jgi:hypothetical protein